MKIEMKSGTDERRIVTAMIVNKSVLGSIYTKWNRKYGLFSSRWANLVTEWCCSHYAKYKDAPNKQIITYYEKWCEREKDKEMMSAVSNYIEALSDEHDKLGKNFSVDFILDSAAVYFNRVSLQALQDEIQNGLEGGEIEKVQEKVQKHRKIEIGQGCGIDLFSDMEAFKKASLNDRKPVITYPGALKNFFGFSLERNGLIAMMGKNKVGKSFWLMDIAWRAATEHKLNTAFFGIGDMSQDQYIHRFMSRVMGQPYRASREEPAVLKVPVEFENTGDYTRDVLPELNFEEKIYTQGLDPKQAWKKITEIRKKSGNRMKLSCHANGTVSMNTISTIMERWIMDGWVPDVVVIDYADLLTAGPGFDPSDRESINQKWKDMRGLSQIMDCLVVTATQSDTPGFDAKVLTRKNFNGDRRILDHVTGMVGINQNAAENAMGIVRLNWIVARDWEFNEEKCVTVAGCKGICCPAMLSAF